MPDAPPRLLPSLMDRLLDPDSMGGRSAGYDHARMAASVRADLEDLLNARRSFLDIPPEFPESAGSVLSFGLPDLSAVDVSDNGSRADLVRAVQWAVSRFEPRLRKVRVTVDRTPPKNDERPFGVKFRIEAELNVDPAPEVGFETVVELTTGRATVDQKDGR